MQANGAAGLSRLDAYAWKRLCSSFGSASRDLCWALAMAGHRLCSTFVHPDSVSAFIVCRLIPLNKCPGVRPIGVGKVPRHIIGKPVLKIVSEDVEAAAGPLQVAAGLSGLDAYAWRLCSSFSSASRDLCSALAMAGRRLCSTFVHPDSISAFVACCLILLNKCPGVRPIGVGKVPQHIIGKAVLKIVGEDAAGPLQVCAGQLGGCKAAIHAMRRIFENPDVLLVDATNAFNQINRQAALHNINVL